MPLRSHSIATSAKFVALLTEAAPSMRRAARSTIASLCGALSIALLACGQVQGENWPQWRGPRGDGISQAKSVPVTWTQTENVRWRCALPGQGGATPVIWDDHIFVTSARGEDLVLLCISAKDGSTYWEQKVTSGNQDARAGEGNSASPSPATDGQHVWAFFGTGTLACYDYSGKEIWKFEVGDRFGAIDIQFGMTSTPVLDGDGLYLQLIHGAMKRDDNTRVGKVVRLDKLTGETVWDFDRVTNAEYECKHSYASPLIYNDGQQKFLIAHGADCTTGHDLQTGKEIWRLDQLNGPSKFTKEHDATYRFVASPAAVPGWIIVPTAKSGPSIALNVSDQLKGPKIAESSSVQWALPQTPDVSIPLIYEGLVYNLHTDGKLQCIDLQSGKQVYFERTHTVQHRSSPVVVGGMIYLCGKDGVTSVVKAGRKFELVATNKLESPITASPAIAGGTLYIRTYEALYAIE